MQNDIIKRPPSEVTERSPKRDNKAPDIQVQGQNTEKLPEEVAKPETTKSLQPTLDNIEPQLSKKDLKKLAQTQQQSQPKPTNQKPVVTIITAIIFCLVLVGLVLYSKTSR